MRLYLVTSLTGAHGADLAGNEGIDEVHRRLREGKVDIPPPGGVIHPLDQPCDLLVQLHKAKHASVAVHSSQDYQSCAIKPGRRRACLPRSTHVKGDVEGEAWPAYLGNSRALTCPLNDCHLILHGLIGRCLHLDVKHLPLCLPMRPAGRCPSLIVLRSHCTGRDVPQIYHRCTQQHAGVP